MTQPSTPSDSVSSVLDSISRSLGSDLRIERELSGGGMARVFVVRDLALSRFLAVKVFAPERSGSMSAERFRREILTVAKLQHPNIVPLLSAGSADGVPYFLMPYIEGASLRAVIRPDGMPISTTVRLLTDMVRALSYAHDVGVVHRDIKPDNILLSGDTAVVSDFGVAKAVASAFGSGERPETVGLVTGTGMSFGTPMYMAPEQVAADPSADHRVDFYALGVTAYEMLTGRPPFHGESPQALLAAKLTRSPTSLAQARSDVSPELEEIIMHCLAVDADKRPDNAATILEALSNPAVMSTSGAMFTGARVAVARAKRRKLGMRISAVLVTLLVISSFLFEQAPVRSWVAQVGGFGGASNEKSGTVAAPLPPLDQHAIAVIPFVDMSDTTNTARFATSLTESVRGGLAATPGLRVAAASVTIAAVQAKGDVREAARSLGTGFVLTGVIDREGENLRLSLQLISASDGLSRWATTVDGDAGKRFEFETKVIKEISQSISNAMLE